MNDRVHVDANVILRFLRNDDEEQSPRAAALLQMTQSGSLLLLVSPVTLMEVFYVLSRAYRMERKEAARLLATLLSSAALVCDDGGVTIDALARITSNQVSFGDSFLAATAARANEPIATFDQGLASFTDVQFFPLDTLPPPKPG